MLCVCFASSALQPLNRRALLSSTAAAAAAPAIPTAALQPSIAAQPVPPPSVPFDEIAGPQPGRRYAFVTLPSGLRCIVCSDEAITRCEIAVTVGCGSLDDPPSIEGLAHLAEHITLAADQPDPAGLAQFIEERQGDLNAFTGERTTASGGDPTLESGPGPTLAPALHWPRPYPSVASVSPAGGFRHAPPPPAHRSSTAPLT